MRLEVLSYFRGVLKHIQGDGWVEVNTVDGYRMLYCIAKEATEGHKIHLDDGNERITQGSC